MSESSFESDEDFNFFGRKALDVELPSDFDPNKVPQNGEEYVQHVMYEARRCQQLVVANIDKKKLKNATCNVDLIAACKKAPKSMIPSLQWQESLVRDFEKLSKFVGGKLSEHPTNGEVPSESLTATETPKLSMLTDMTEPAKIKLFEQLINGLDYVQKGESIAYTTGVWLYTVLATLKIPLDPQTYSLLRELARKCAEIRSNLDERCDKEMYYHLNVFICIVARYFKQLDLADGDGQIT